MSCFSGPCIGLYQNLPAQSGYHLAQLNPGLPSGYYWIKNDNMPNALQMYVDMTQEGGGYDFYVITSGTPADRARADSTVWTVGAEGTTGTSSNGNGAVHSGITLGLDIVYPRSKQHWIAIYNFVEGILGQNVNSYFTSNIGAVFRNTTVGNGSGNYTSRVMRDPNYYGTGAPDWRVPDGGRWWLRDSVYTEPNGDYANYGFLGNRGIPRPYTGQDLVFNDLANYSQTTGTTYLVSTNAKP